METPDNYDDLAAEYAFARLKEISDTIVGLKNGLPLFPTNQWHIDQLEAERKELIRQYVRDATPYP